MSSLSSLEDFLQFLPLECGPLKTSSSNSALKPTRPSASGLTWLAVPRNCIGLAYRIAPGTHGGTELQAVQITISSAQHHEIKIVGTAKLGIAAAAAVHIAASHDGRLVAVATADGSLHCYDCIQQQQQHDDVIQFQERWVLHNVHSHNIGTTTHTSSSTSSSHRFAAAGASAGPVRSMQFASDYTLLLVDAAAAGGGDSGGKGLLVLIQANSTNPAIVLQQQQPLLSSIQVSCASWDYNNNTAQLQQQQQQQRLAVGDASGKVHFYNYLHDVEKSAAKLVEITSFDFPGGNQGEEDTDAIPWSCTHLDWFTPTSLAAGYCRIEMVEEDDEDDNDDDEEEEDQDDVAQHEAELFILDFNHTAKDDDDYDWEKNNPPTCNISSCGDVVPFFAVPKHGRHVFYSASVPTTSSNNGDEDKPPPLLLVASNVASDVGIIAKQDDDNDTDGSPSPSSWTIKDIPEGANITAPTDQETDEFTFALGIGVVQVPTTRGGTTTATTTSPVVLLAATDGSLSGWQVVHEKNATLFQSSSAAATPTVTTTTILPSVPVPAAVVTVATTQPAISTQDNTLLAAKTTSSTSPSSSLFGSTTVATTATPSSFGFGSMAAAAPSFGTGSGGFSFGSPPPPAAAAAATPGSSVFGMTSLLGPKPPPPDIINEAAAAAAASALTSSGFVFGSGTAAPSFAATSSPSGAGGGFAALAAAAAASNNSPPAASAFGSAAASAGFPTPSNAAAASSSSSSQFNIFAKSATSSGLSAMAKPLFDSSSSSSAPAAANAETKEQAFDNDAKENPFAAFSNKPASAAAGSSFGGATTTSTTGSSGFSFGPPKSAASDDTKGFLFSPLKSDAGAAVATAALAESRDETVQDQSLHDSVEAKNAARAFDSFDAQKTGVVPREKLEDLLEELGEGFYGDELDEQIALMDPDGSGQLKRSPFINWYVKLSQTKSKYKKNGDDDDDDSSMDSDERAEREEEAENCRERFSMLSQDDNKTIKVEDFEKLIESFGTTYCADGAHGRAKKKLDMDGVIYLEDFIAWYLDWYFGEDDESDDDEQNQPSNENQDESTGPPATTSTTTTAAGWGNMFAAKAGSWKCDSCMLRNDDATATKCVSCDTPRPGATVVASSATETGDAKAPASAIGPGGFTFGGGGGAPASAIGPSGFTFGGDGSTSLSSSTGGPTFGGLAIRASAGDKVESESSTNNTATNTGIGKGGFTFASQGMGTSGSAEPSIKPDSGFSFGAPVASQSLSGTKGFMFSSSTTGSSTSTPGKSSVEKVMATSAAAQKGSTSAETRNEPVVQDQTLDSIEAKNAARAFDSFDASKTGVVSRDKLEDLLEELGEGFYGDELDEQIALMDPDGSGQLKRSSFINWYVKLSQTLGRNKGGDDDSSMDSEERAEREEETQKCRDCFSQLSQDSKTIKVEDFEKLIESFGTTYCADGAHGRAKKQLDKNGSIELDDFIAWYLEWYFGEDDDEYDEEESSDENSEDEVAGNQAPTTAGWGNMFAAKAGSWKCESCMLRNDDASATKCVSCDTPRPGATATVSSGGVKAPAAGGFSFGGVTTGGSKASAIGPGGFAFGSAMSSSNTGATLGGNKDEGTKPGFGFGSTSSSGGFSFGGTSTAAADTGFLSSSGATPFSSGTTFGMSSSSSGSGFMSGQPKATTSTSAVESTAAVSSSAYPPMSKVAPKKIDEPKAPAATSSSYPPLSKLAPTPADKTSSAYPPMAAKAPSKVDFGTSKPATTSSYPPMSKAAPSKVDFGAPKPAAASSYPPLSAKAPSKVDFGAPQQTPATSSAYPPMSSKAPSKVEFGAAKPATASSPYPPMSKTAPSKVDFGPSKPVAASAYPPMSKVAPSKVDFGAPKPVATSSYPPMSAKPPSKVDFGAPKPPATSSYPPMSKAAPSKVDFGTQKPAVTSAYPPMSVAAPSKVDFGAQKSTPTSIFHGKPASAAPRYGHPSALGFTKDETLSECATEFTGLVTKMQKSLDLVASGLPADQDDELRSSIEDLVHGVKTILASFGENNASLGDCKRTSAKLFAKTDEALRKASEAQRLIDDQQSDRGNDFLQVQPLDAASEKLQRAISAHGILFDRYLSLLRDRSLLVEQLCTPDAKYHMACSLVDITKKVHGFDDETKKLTSQCMKLSSTGSQFLLSPGKPVSTLTTRQQGNIGEAHKSSFNRRLLHMSPSSFDEIRSSRVKSFSLDRKLPKSAEKPRPERGLLAADTSRSPARGVELSALQQFGPTSPIFSSPEPARHRSGWDKVSKVDQTRSKQVSFASPRDLREISLDAAARDALSPYGTTPEKVQGAIAIQNRVDTPALSKRSALSTPSVHDSKDPKARSKTDGKMPSSTFSLLPSTKPAPVELSESRQPPQQGSNASQVSVTSTPGTISSFPSTSAEGSQPGSSGMFSSFPSSVTKPSQAETNPADAAASKPSTGSAGTAKAGSAFGSMSVLGSSLFSTGLESRSGPVQTEVQVKSNEEPDHAAILAAFYQTHNPSKAGDAKKMVEKYKGREAEMFMKLGKKYGVPSPLEPAKGSSSATAPNVASNLSTQPFAYSGSGSSPFSIQKPPMAPSPFTSAAAAPGPFTSAAAAPSPFTSTAATPSPFTSASAAPVSSPLFGAAPSTSHPTFDSAAPTFGSPTLSSAGFTAPAPAFGNPSTPAPSFGSTATPSFPSTQSFGFGSTATSQSPFGGGSLTTAGGSSPFGPPAPAFSGRSPRELLTAFYQQYNASKISDVDKLLAKYQGKEEHMFRQLAKKYNLDPSVFGLSPSPVAPAGFGSPALSTGFSSPGGFGSPSVLGGGPVFGGAAPSASPFGASSGGFGQSAGGFGSASGTSFSTGPSFGALAHAPGVGGFGSPPAGIAPFGAPRR